MLNFRNALLAIVTIFVCLMVTESQSQEPGWTSKVIKRGEDRRVSEATPILERPYRPMHFYGNRVRRKHYQGHRRPSMYDRRMTVNLIRSR